MFFILFSTTVILFFVLGVTKNDYVLVAFLIGAFCTAVYILRWLYKRNLIKTLLLVSLCGWVPAIVISALFEWGDFAAFFCSSNLCALVWVANRWWALRQGLKKS